LGCSDASHLAETVVTDLVSAWPGSNKAITVHLAGQGSGDLVGQCWLRSRYQTNANHLDQSSLRPMADPRQSQKGHRDCEQEEIHDRI